MKVLLAHPVFPGQFGLLAEALAQEGHDVVFLTHAGRCDKPGITLECYTLVSRATIDAPVHLIATEQAILHAEAAMFHAAALKQRGFSPDVIIGHAGMGQLALMREVFPNAAIIAYAEYFYRSYGADVGFDPALALSTEDYPRVRLKNAATLLSLDAADAAYSPTEWQCSLFPPAYQQGIAVIHDGVDTAQFRRKKKGDLGLPSAPLITFAARSLEYYRGFHKFWPAMVDVLSRRPKVHALVVGTGSPAYGPAEGEDLLHRMRAEYPCATDRVHFAESLSRSDYMAMLQRSACHVYLTYPFVPSWSLIEAMASKTPLVVSNVAPVREVVGEGAALYVDFFDTDALAEAIIAVLDDKPGARRRAQRASDRAQEEYDFHTKSWPKLRALINGVREKRSAA